MKKLKSKELKGKRLKAAWDEDYLRKLLNLKI
jgi:hypothetical protein